MTTFSGSNLGLALRSLPNKLSPELIIYRLTALWGFSEAVLGGILHALKIPVTGLVVGGLAVCLLTLMAVWADKPSRILIATFHVLVIKFLVSPHTPPFAYSAVLFQGVVAYLLFPSRKFVLLFGLGFGVITMVYSALLKVLTLTIIFGNSLWIAIDRYAAFIATQFGIPFSGNVSFSKVLILTYLAVHILAGLLTGSIAQKLNVWIIAGISGDSISQLQAALKSSGDVSGFSRQSSSRSAKWLLILILLCGVVAGFYFLPQFRSTWWGIFLRAAAILTLWFFVLAPNIRKLLSKVFRRGAEKHHAFYDSVVRSFPALKVVTSHAFSSAAGVTGLLKIKVFLTTLFVGALFAVNE